MPSARYNGICISQGNISVRYHWRNIIQKFTVFLLSLSVFATIVFLKYNKNIKLLGS